MKTQNIKVKRWHFDNDDEFILNIIIEIVKINDIVHESTIFYNLEQNEFAKRFMHII